MSLACTLQSPPHIHAIYSLNNEPYLKTSVYVHGDFIIRAWRINRINGINITNRINNRLINPCKLGLGLIQINMD